MAPLPFPVPAAPALVGRDELLVEVRRRLSTVGRAMLTGCDGSGKSAILGVIAAEHGAGTVRASGTPDGSAGSLAGAVLAEVLAGLELGSLPGPQRLAARQALRLEPGEPDSLALRLGVLAALRAAAPVLVVVDDAHLIDAESAGVLAYALRRAGPGVRLLAAGRRLGWDLGPPLEVPPLGPGEVAAFLEAHGLSCRLAGPVHAASGGNPALMLDIAFGGDGSGLARKRLASVPEGVRRGLLPAALAHAPTVGLLRRAGCGAAELAAAEAAGLVTIAGDRVEFTAGALAEGLVAGAGWADRAAAHRVLADLADDPVDQVRHRALATDLPCARLAAQLAGAGQAARSRGHRTLAAELHLLAAERTPPADQPSAETRLLAAAEDAGASGHLDLARQAAQALLARATGPASRVHARLAVIDAAGQAFDDLDETFAHALAEAAGDPALLAAVHLRLAWKANLTEGSPQRALAASARAAALAAQGGDVVLEAMALTMRARAERILGVPDAERTLAAALALGAPEEPMGLRNTPSYLAARHAVYDDQLTTARTMLLGLLPAAERSGAEDLIEVLRSLAEIEARSGRCATALEHAHRAARVTGDAGLSPGPAWYTVALAEACGGSFGRAAWYADLGARSSEEEHDVVFLARNLHVHGLVKLALGDAAGAVAALSRVGSLEADGYVLDPAVLRWHADLAAAHVAAGEHDEGHAVITRTRQAASTLDRPGVLAALDRAEGLYRSALGDPAGAIDLLDRSAAGFALLGLPVEHGRTLLALGQVERRRRRRSAARDAMSAAFAAFEQAAARPWAELALTALDQLDAPAEPGPPLTTTELRIAELVGRGASNREIAARLFLSVKTVEATLTRVYRKLGVRSRTQLCTRLRETE
ncbi:helix-turn-helix transcriptional regulator [Longispora albida]|uniref:helix-turn-helix transcriptional regulator n=1 Tax=Longispora albida TaxID=203523 RepID=UPI000363C8BE|nr:LuxR family transcriptional regulator [Longispora albida]